MSSFFSELANEGDEYASRQVRTRLGRTYLRDNEVDGIRLPPSYTKRQLYVRCCFESGWIVGRGGSDGSLGSIKNFQKQ